MSFLKDKEWDEMDWLNKAVEPFTFSFNEEFAKIPSEYALTYRDIVHHLSSTGELYLTIVVRRIAERCGISSNGMLFMDLIGIETLFELKLEPDTELDLETETIIGGVSLVKTVESFNDDMIREMLPQMVVQSFRPHFVKVTTTKINEVMDILDCKEGRSSSSIRKKIAGLKDHIYNIYRDNTWNIRNVDLAIKMLGWIQSYCENGDRCSLANLSKLKCMIHNGHPIYSMEEIV